MSIGICVVFKYFFGVFVFVVLDFIKEVFVFVFQILLKFPCYIFYPSVLVAKHKTIIRLFRIARKMMRDE